MAHNEGNVIDTSNAIAQYHPVAYRSLKFILHLGKRTFSMCGGHTHPIPSCLLGDPSQKYSAHCWAVCSLCDLKYAWYIEYRNPLDTTDVLKSMQFTVDRLSLCRFLWSYYQSVELHFLRSIGFAARAACIYVCSVTLCEMSWLATQASVNCFSLP